MEATERLTPHFSVAEMACRCCGQVLMDPGFMAQLEALRVAYGEPMIITSGYRCPAHNVRVATTGPDGPHTTGQAADVQVCGRQAHRLMGLAWALGFSGIGVKLHGPHLGRYVHLDTLNAPTYPRPILWSYP